MTQAELERRILELERKVAGGGTCGSPGFSTLFGIPSNSYRDRFPVELTSGYDATTGYDWQRLFLTVGNSPPVDTAASPQAGSYAFTPDNDETLASGDRGWLEADPTAAGWILVRTTAAGGAAECSVSCGTHVGWLDAWCLGFEVVCHAGRFADLDPEQEFDGVPLSAAHMRSVGAKQWRLQYWDDTGSAWANFVFDWCGGTGTVTLTFDPDGRPILTVGANQMWLVPCNSRDLVFAGGYINGFSGCSSDPSTPCSANDFLVRITCGVCASGGCPIDGFEGDGWYCVVASSQTCGVDTPGCVYLSVEDGSACDASIKICGGRYADQATCQAACTGGGSFGSCSGPPSLMSYTVASDGCLNGHTDILSETVGDTSWADDNAPSPCATDLGFTLSCAGAGVWSATYDGQPLTLTGQTSTTLTFQYTPVSPVTGTFATFTVNL